MFKKLRALFVIGLPLLLLPACDTKEWLEKWVPKDDDAFARRFIDALRAADFAATDQMLAPSLNNEKTQAGLRQISQVLGRGEVLTTEVIGCFVSYHASSQTTNLSYQLHLSEGWVAGNVVIAREEGKSAIVGAAFQSIPDSLEVTHQFTFAGKSLRHYLVFVICVVIPGVVLVALVLCIRSRVRRKWLWILFILLGVVQFRFNWTSGKFDIQPLSFLLFGGSALRGSLHAPWILGFALPVGAVVFLIKRRTLVLKHAAPPPPPLPAAPAPQPPSESQGSAD